MVAVKKFFLFIFFEVNIKQLLSRESSLCNKNDLFLSTRPGVSLGSYELQADGYPSSLLKSAKTGKSGCQRSQRKKEHINRLLPRKNCEGLN